MKGAFFNRVFLRPFRHSTSISLSSLLKRPITVNEICCRIVSSVEPITPMQSPAKDKNPLKHSLIEETPSEGLDEKRRKRRRQKKGCPAYVTTKLIFDAAKRNDCPDAMEKFRTARESGVELPQTAVNSILYLLVGGEDWFERALTAFQPDAAPNSDRKDLRKCRDEVLEYMKEQKMLHDDIVFVMQARIAVCLGDPDEAFTVAKQNVESAFPARLRVFTPALLGYREQGEMEKALEVQHVMESAALDLTEFELRMLLQVCSQPTGRYQEIETLLKKMGKELTFLEKATIEVARHYFTSRHSLKAFGEGVLSNKQMWLVDDVTVDANGYSLTSGENLTASDLSDEDWESFLAAVEKLATKREPKQKPFKEFVQWLDNHGPFPIVIDGANVALHKQNMPCGGFSFRQIYFLVQHLQHTFPERKILLVLHYYRTKNEAAMKPQSYAFLSRMTQSNQLCVAPANCNDDWYWLYAALYARGDGLLVSNDECRDHIFQLLAPKYFLKWKERHLVRYEFVHGAPTIQLPSLYTCCTQQLGNGTWMLPYRDDDEKEKWLCAKAL